MQGTKRFVISNLDEEAQKEFETLADRFARSKWNEQNHREFILLLRALFPAMKLCSYLYTIVGFSAQIPEEDADRFVSHLGSCGYSVREDFKFDLESRNS